MSDDQGASIPGQVAARLVGRSFRNFRGLREAIWKAIADTPELVQPFNEQNLRLMRSGTEPIAPRHGHVVIRGKLSRRGWEMRHSPSIEDGGNPYDLSIIKIVTPRRRNLLDGKRVEE